MFLAENLCKPVGGLVPKLPGACGKAGNATGTGKGTAVPSGTGAGSVGNTTVVTPAPTATPFTGDAGKMRAGSMMAMGALLVGIGRAAWVV